jgi:hypothetical protein
LGTRIDGFTLSDVDPAVSAGGGSLYGADGSLTAGEGCAAAGQGEGAATAGQGGGAAPVDQGVVHLLHVVMGRGVNMSWPGSLATATGSRSAGTRVHY